jgi:hypothetical protein
LIVEEKPLTPPAKEIIKYEDYCLDDSMDDEYLEIEKEKDVFIS